MAMTEVGQATITIIPNMKGAQEKITKDLGATGDKSGNDSGDSFVKALLGKVKQAGVGLAIGKFINDSLDAGAKLQQSFGGLETLYGDAAEYAKEYAYQAAQAGISANDYAEQAVSFGASLKKAFGGDTTKAVEAANTAIMDMTDNAAKMGTPIESIQNAYQGFAKGQYNMLDNLKLGYGGTKTEMERLLADATKLSGVEYNIDNLGDVYEAIHVIQEDLGLTGVAAEEAATTFSGSFGAMQASAQNLLADLSMGEEIGPDLYALGNSIKTFVVGNLLPMIGNLVSQIPSIIAAIPGFVADLLPDLVSGVADIVAQLASGIVENAPVFIAGLRELLMSIPEAFSSIDWGSVGSTVINGLTSAMESVWGAIQDLFSVTFGVEIPDFETITQNISDLWESVKAGIGEFFKAAFDIITDDDASITEKIGALWELVESGISGYFQTVFSVITPVAETIATAISNWWGENVWPTIQNIFQAVFGIELPSWDDISQKISEGWNTIKETVASFITSPFSVTMPAFGDVVEAINGLWTEVYNGITGWFNATFGLEIPTWEDVSEAISSFWEDVKAGIAGWFKAVFGVDPPDVSTVTEAIGTAWNTVKEGIGSFFKTVFEVGVPLATGLTSKIGTLWAEVKKGIGNFFATVFKLGVPLASSLIEKISTLWNSVKEGIGSFFSWLFSLELPSVDDIVSTLKGWWESITKAVESLFSIDVSANILTPEQQAIIDNANKHSSTYQLNEDTVSIDSEAIQKALSEANLTLADVDTSSIDKAKEAVTSAVSEMEKAFKNAVLALPTINSHTLGTVRTLVSGTVAAIKSTMNFYWSLPTLHGSLPVISVNMRQASSSDGKTTVNYPDLSVSSYKWFSKGGIFNQPTVIGIGDSKGPEAAVPLDMMWSRLDKEFDKHKTGATVNNYITVDGAQDPEAWATAAARTMARELRMA